MDGAYFAEPRSFMVLAAMMILRVLAHGNNAYSPLAYIFYGIVQVNSFRRIEEGYKLGRVCLSLSLSLSLAILEYLRRIANGLVAAKRMNADWLRNARALYHQHWTVDLLVRRVAALLAQSAARMHRVAIQR